MKLLLILPRVTPIYFLTLSLPFSFVFLENQKRKQRKKKKKIHKNRNYYSLLIITIIKPFPINLPLLFVIKCISFIARFHKHFSFLLRSSKMASNDNFNRSDSSFSDNSVYLDAQDRSIHDASSSGILLCNLRSCIFSCNVNYILAFLSRVRHVSGLDTNTISRLHSINLFFKFIFLAIISVDNMSGVRVCIGFEEANKNIKN